MFLGISGHPFLVGLGVLIIIVVIAYIRSKRR